MYIYCRTNQYRHLRDQMYNEKRKRKKEKQKKKVYAPHSPTAMVKHSGLHTPHHPAPWTLDHHPHFL